eukprot:scaffold1222_cov260-Chaetoceros_neogracile.AAC.64
MAELEDNWHSVEEESDHEDAVLPTELKHSSMTLFSTLKPELLLPGARSDVNTASRILCKPARGEGEGLATGEEEKISRSSKHAS